MSSKSAPQSVGAPKLTAPRSEASSVFIVHGHDEAACEAAARFIEKLGLIAVILREQPNQGRTLIEKFEASSGVAFAVVLLTPDDIGATAANPKVRRPRARQNVIFELGFFIGTIGRRRVCALYKPGVELPTDYLGVAYVEMDSGGAWRLKLAQELREAGFNVDLNLVL